MYRVVAYVSDVGYACSEECGNDAVADITADHGEAADAGLDPVTNIVRHHGVDQHCMGCGRNLSTNQEG
jgi:hypothetical protein